MLEKGGLNESEQIHTGNDNQQQYYYNHIIANASQREDRIMSIHHALQTMRPECRLSICIPVCNEPQIIQHALDQYATHQVGSDGKMIDPNLFEINILINRPNSETKRDEDSLRKIQEFRENNPHFCINTAEVTYNFRDRPVIGMIFKDLVDAILVRNLARTQGGSKNLVIRTTGADVESIHPRFVERTLRIFSDQSVVAHRGASRLPPEILRKIPLLHVIQTLAVFLLRQYHGKGIVNGPFSYTAEAYAMVGGFDEKRYVGEEVDLSKKIYQTVVKSQGKLKFRYDCVRDVINNPRRQVLALLSGSPLGTRYRHFGDERNERSIRDLSASWAYIEPDTLPQSAALTPENLSREVSVYYQEYLSIAAKSNRKREEIDTIFQRGMRVIGITDYSFNPKENTIEIGSIPYSL